MKRKNTTASKSTLSTASTQHNIAGLRQRLFAMFYDAFLIGALLFCTLAVYVITIVSISGDFNQATDVVNNDVLYNAQPTPLGWPIYPILIAVYVGFYLYFWQATGQTLGMQVWKIKLVSKDGLAVSKQQGLTRIIGAALSVFAAGFGYWVLLLNKDNGTWHDRWSKTHVISLADSS